MIWTEFFAIIYRRWNQSRLPSSVFGFLVHLETVGKDILQAHKANVSISSKVAPTEFYLAPRKGHNRRPICLDASKMTSNAQDNTRDSNYDTHKTAYNIIIHESHVFHSGVEPSRVKTPWMNRQPLAAGALSGTLVTLAHRFLTLSEPLGFPLEPLPCLDLEQNPLLFGLEWRSFFIGIFVGILIFPIAEVLWFLRLWWTTVVRRQLAALARSGWPLYREIV